MSRLPNQPRSAEGHAEEVARADGARGAGCALVGGVCVIQVEYRFMTEGVGSMAESVQSGLVQAAQVAREAEVLPGAQRHPLCGVRREPGIAAGELARVVQAVPSAIAAALARKTYYFVPLALAEGRSSGAEGHRSGHEETMIAPAYTAELADAAICHRNVALGGPGGRGRVHLDAADGRPLLAELRVLHQCGARVCG